MKADYYVYLHKFLETGEIFYIGKGRNHRLRNTCRSLTWLNVVGNKAWVYEIYRDNLTSDEALDLEIELITELNPRANVQRKDTRQKPIHWKDFNETYYVDPSSPTGLRHVHGNSAFGSTRRRPGDVAGHLRRDGYMMVRYKGKSYLCHRIVWAISTKVDLQDGVIDHINGIRDDNRIENLRKVTISENNKNVKNKAVSESGYKGVYLSDDKNQYGAAWVSDEGVRHVKWFSSLYYGKDLALGLAMEVRQRATLNCTTYLPDTDYKRHDSIAKMSEEEITNLLNCELMSTNTSGVQGLAWSGKDKTIIRTQRTVDGVRKSKTFPTSEFGLLPALKLAIEWLQENK